jgi:hypothetical protein
MDWVKHNKRKHMTIITPSNAEAKIIRRNLEHRAKAIRVKELRRVEANKLALSSVSEAFRNAVRL